MHPVDISIIIVNYNSGELLLNCINSIFSSITLSLEVVVIDNNSHDHSIQLVKEAYPNNDKVIIIDSKENHGFAKGNNIAAEQSRGKILHFLNPDTLVSEQLNADYNYIIGDNKEAVYVHKLKNSTAANNNKYLIPTLGNYLRRIFNPRKAWYWGLGASVIMSRKIFDIVGGWPEDYFMYSEDLDLFYNSQRKGINIDFLNQYIFHIEKGCTDTVWNKERRLFIIESANKKFYKKYKKTFEYFIIKGIISFYILFRTPREYLLYLKVLFKVNFPGAKRNPES